MLSTLVQTRKLAFMICIGITKAGSCGYRGIGFTYIWRNVGFTKSQIQFIDDFQTLAHAPHVVGAILRVGFQVPFSR
ncbi:hypothetical protein EDD85DRAFT_813502 [Armillaria nabsnona]|nr:hypothetical protein EDD85DRAFT_813502 [Armillaria nabsnona]